MKHLRWIGITANCFSAFSFFVLSNTVLVLPPNRSQCVTVFEVPFTEKSFELPLWMWRGPLWLLVISTFTAPWVLDSPLCQVVEITSGTEGNSELLNPEMQHYGQL